MDFIDNFHKIHINQKTTICTKTINDIGRKILSQLSICDNLEQYCLAKYYLKDQMVDNSQVTPTTNES